MNCAPKIDRKPKQNTHPAILEFPQKVEEENCPDKTFVSRFSTCKSFQFSVSILKEGIPDLHHLTKRVGAVEYWEWRRNGCLRRKKGEGRKG